MIMTISLYDYMSSTLLIRRQFKKPKEIFIAFTMTKSIVKFKKISFCCHHVIHLKYELFLIEVRNTNLKTLKYLI